MILSVVRRNTSHPSVTEQSGFNHSKVCRFSDAELGELLAGVGMTIEMVKRVPPISSTVPSFRSADQHFVQVTASSEVAIVDVRGLYER